MGLFSSSPTFDSMEDLLVDQLRDIYDAEKRLTKALPKMADAASEVELKQAFLTHHRETQNHVRRLERVFQLMGKKADAKTCEAMKGLIAEGEEMVNAGGDPAVRDAALIAAAQRVEHYEIAAYGSARTFAQRLGLNDAAALLQETLDEEGKTDKLLTAIAERHVNVAAPAR
ncbi:MAG TPA: ferritin-like domain-containing protein [Gemmataceae bacterium]